MELCGYLLEELRDPKNFEAFKKDVADGESLLFSACCTFWLDCVSQHQGRDSCQEGCRRAATL